MTQQPPATPTTTPGTGSSAADQVVHQSVQHTLAVGQRVFGDGGIAQQIVDGDWDGRFNDTAAGRVAARWNALGEHIRAVCADTGDATRHTDPLVIEPSRDWLCGLPLNRKERYYTGTVLPGLVGSDGFAHLGRFLGLCGLDPAQVTGTDTRVDAAPALLFCTEYGFAESVFAPDERQLWGSGLDGDTPDVVIAGPGWLLAVEAKMFHNPSRDDLDRQMRRQAVLVDRWVEVLGLDRDHVKHVLLLPDQLATATAGHRWDVVTWQDVLTSYAHVGPRYWVNVLATALADYDLRVSTGPAFGKNKDARLTGAEIVDLHAEGTLPYTSVGRVGGLEGEAFHGDVAGGNWRTRSYEVRAGDTPNPHWFPIADFIAATAHT